MSYDLEILAKIESGDYICIVEEYDFQEAEMIEAFVDFQNDLLLYGIGFELRNEVQ
jgi:hypothetical protein